jgi:hypothetical protein
MGVSVLAAIRPDDVNVALLVHVAGAMILVGGLVTAGTALTIGWRDTGATTALRLGYFTLLAVALPGWFIMRIGGQWTESEENLPEDFEPAWLGIGYITADLGGIVLLLGLILGGVGVRKLRAGGGAGLLKATTVITLLLVAAYVIAVWAMSGKPD